MSDSEQIMKKPVTKRPFSLLSIKNAAKAYGVKVSRELTDYITTDERALDMLAEIVEGLNAELTLPETTQKFTYTLTWFVDYYASKDSENTYTRKQVTGRANLVAIVAATLFKCAAESALASDRKLLKVAHYQPILETTHFVVNH